MKYALLLCAALLLWRQDVVAGTTGSLTGTVVDAATKAPIAGATVTATSPSQVARVTTDSAGRFTFISLAPDTFTISGRTRRIRDPFDHGHLGLRRPEPDYPDRAAALAQDDCARCVALVAQPGSAWHGHRRLLR